MSAWRSRWSAASTPPTPNTLACARRCRASLRWSACTAASSSRCGRRRGARAPRVSRRRGTSGARYGLFLTFDAGMQLLTDTLAARLERVDGVTVRLNTRVEAGRAFARFTRMGRRDGRRRTHRRRRRVRRAPGLRGGAPAARRGRRARRGAGSHPLRLDRDGQPRLQARTDSAPARRLRLRRPLRRAPRRARLHLQQREVRGPRARRVRAPARLRRRRLAARDVRPRRSLDGRSRPPRPPRPARRRSAAPLRARREVAALDGAVHHRPPPEGQPHQRTTADRARAPPSPGTPTTARASPTASAAARPPPSFYSAS